MDSLTPAGPSPGERGGVAAEGVGVVGGAAVARRGHQRLVGMSCSPRLQKIGCSPHGWVLFQGQALPARLAKRHAAIAWWHFNPFIVSV